MTIPHDAPPELGILPVHIVSDQTRPSRTNSLVRGYGFTISRGAGDAPVMPLLNEDPMRIRALIMTNLVCYIGDPEQMSSITAQMGATDAGPGARIPTALSSPYEIQTQAEVWAGFTGVTALSVWIERLVPGGMR
jgi:hypothetical protein